MKMITLLQTRRNRIACRLAVLTIGLFTLLQTADAGFSGRHQPENFLESVPGSFEGGTGVWNLGPLGVFGFANGTPYMDSRQFLVREVLPGTLADGRLRQHDVILGVLAPDGWEERVEANPGDFMPNFYILRSIAYAIEEAEKQGGTLKLKVWRPETEEVPVPDGISGAIDTPKSWSVRKEPVNANEIEVEIPIPARGAFSKTSPWNCPRASEMIEQLAGTIMARGLPDGRGHASQSITAALDALGLLATGEEKYLPLVRDYARAVAGFYEGSHILDNPKNTGSTWTLAYENLFLAEYYLATGDKEVLPGFTDLSMQLAMGRSAVGTFSHGLVQVDLFGLYGPASSYGAMNQCSITANMSLALARKAGLDKKEIDDAVEIGAEFLRWFVDKGTIAYGDNPPWMDHESNGVNSQAAVFFDIIGDRHSADYFTRMTLASARIRTQGHTGHYFNTLWGPPGAARGGPAAAHAFMDLTRWYQILEQRVDGSAAFNGPGRYGNWSTAGVHLLHLCLPRQQLHITGKGGNSMAPLSQEALKKSIDNGRFVRLDSKRSTVSGMSVPELLAELGSANAYVRHKVAGELGRRDENVVNELLAMLKGPDRYARYGALLALKETGRISDEAMDEMLRILREEKDITLRRYASGALGSVRGARGLEKVMPAMLQLVIDYKTGDSVTPENYLEDKLNGMIADSAFSIVYGDNIWRANENSFEGVDRDLLYPALRSMLVNPVQAGPGRAITIINRFLDEEEQAKFLGAIYLAVKNPPPSSNSVQYRVQGTSMLARRHIKEAMPLAYGMMMEPTHGRFWRIPLGMEALGYFGKAAAPHFEDMQKMYEQFIEGRRPREVQRMEAVWQKVLENKDKEFELKSIQPYLDAM